MNSATQTGPLSDLIQYRQLLLSLTWRDLKVRYKQSLLGMAWAVLVPLSMMVIFTFVFTRMINVVEHLSLGMPYPLFAYIGLVPWAFFSAGLNRSANSLVANRALLTKVYFPREVFPFSSVASAFADFCVASTVLIGLVAYFQLTTDWVFRPSWALLFLPVVLLIQVTLTCGLGMLLATANAFFRDIRHVFAAFIQMWMFMTCVVYPIRNDGSLLGKIAVCNPMTPIIQAYRDCIIGGRLPQGGAFWTACVTSVIVFVAGWYCLRRLSYKLAEYV